MAATIRAFSLAAVTLALAALAFAASQPAPLVAAATAIASLAAALAGRSETYNLALWRVEAKRRPDLVRVPEGSTVKIEVEIRNPSGTGLPLILVRDHPHVRARAEEPVFQGSLPAGGALSGSYSVRPAPGLSRIEDITLEARDPLGLYAISRRIKIFTTIQAYPIPYPPTPERPGHGLGLAEPLAARRPGLGAEFYSLRDYTPGDDVRMVAWLPSARAGRLVVRENVEEKRFDACIIADLSLESWAGSPGESPADWAMRAALAVAEASARTGGRVGYAVFLGEPAIWLAPQRAPEAGASLAEVFASTSPGHSSRRRGLERVLRVASEEWPSTCILVALLGPGGAASVASHEYLDRYAWRLVAVEILPTGSSALDVWLREPYRRLEEAHINALREAGAIAYIASTPEQLAVSLNLGVMGAASKLRGALS